MIVSDHRANPDFAHAMQWLADVRQPQPTVIRVVLDHLSTHSPAAFYQTFLAAEARRLTQRFEFHYTPPACRLAQCGRSRVRSARAPVPHPPPGDARAGRRGDRRIEGRPQCRRRDRHVALHDAGRPHALGPALPEASGMITVAIH